VHTVSKLTAEQHDVINFATKKPFFFFSPSTASRTSATLAVVALNSR
jgi:hypothetical protein